ncbi:MAG: Sip1-related alpha-galactosidase [Thermofilum sp.]
MPLKVKVGVSELEIALKLSLRGALEDVVRAEPAGNAYELLLAGGRALLKLLGSEDAVALLVEGEGETADDGLVLAAEVKLPEHSSVLVFHHTYDPPGFLGGQSEPYDYPAVSAAPAVPSAWTFPWHTRSLASLPKDLKISQLLLKLESGYLHLLALPGWGFSGYFTNPGEKVLTIQQLSTVKMRWRTAPLLAAARGSTAAETVSRAFNVAARALGRECLLRSRKRKPSFAEYLGWCTWNAFWRGISEEKVVSGFKELRSKAPFAMVILDDGWMASREGSLSSFEADPEKFPRGLAGLAAKLRELGAEKLGLWITVNGYWNGVDPESDLARDYREVLEDLDGTLAPSPGKAFRFFMDWFRRVKDAGFDFIKADNQLAVASLYAGHHPVEQASSELHEAVEAAAALFNLEILNCMSLNPEHFFSMWRSNTARASIDYSSPPSPSRSKLHLYFNAYNTLWLSQVAWPDWDMFQTKDPLALQQAVARALSGGPVYVSDVPQELKAEVVAPLAFPDGRVPTFPAPALPTEDIAMRDPYNEPVALKLFNKLEVPGLGVYGLVGVFNIYKRDEEIEYAVSPSDAALSAGEYVAYEYFSERFGKVEGSQVLRGKLNPGEVHLYVFAPLKLGFSPVGSRKLYVMPAALHWAKVVGSVVRLGLEPGFPITIYLERQLRVGDMVLQPGLREVTPAKVPLEVRV